MLNVLHMYEKYRLPIEPSLEAWFRKRMSSFEFVLFCYLYKLISVSVVFDRGQ